MLAIVPIILISERINAFINNASSYSSISNKRKIIIKWQNIANIEKYRYRKKIPLSQEYRYRYRKKISLSQKYRYRDIIVTVIVIAFFCENDICANIVIVLFR